MTHHFNLFTCTRALLKLRLSLLVLVALLMVSITIEASQDELGIEFEQDDNQTMDELDIVFEEDEPETVDVKHSNNSLKIRGFIDSRWGTRVRNTDDFDKQNTLFETRLQSNIRGKWQHYKFKLKTDIVHDDVLDGSYLDVREAYIELPPNDRYNIRVGRQSILWGLGDLLVSNDLFPKDYLGLYYGRDAEAEYVVSPIDAIRSSIYFKNSSLDVIFSRFEPSAVPTGQRFSYFNPFAQSIVGEDMALNVVDTDSNAIMARWNTSLFNKEVAFYYNRTHWQTPDGFDPQTREFFYPRLNTLGFSIRNEWGPGIISLDAAYYQSADDKDGDKFWIRNSEIRFILGYDFELAKDLNVGLQWMQEQRQNQDNYRNSLPELIQASPSEYNLLTLRLNKFLFNQKMTLSLFTYYSPTQSDRYVRLNMFYKFDDHWLINIGSNHFSGDVDTRFGQLSDNSNYFAALRWSF